MTTSLLRNRLTLALRQFATQSLHQGACQLWATLGYESRKTLDFPQEPQAFVTELTSLLGPNSTLNTQTAEVSNWRQVAFLFQLTNDELPALAAGQLSLLDKTGGVQTHQIESFVFMAVELQAGGAWSRHRLGRIARELNRVFPMPVVVMFRYEENGLPLLSVAVVHRRTHKRDASKDVIEGKVSIIKDVNLRQPHAAHLRILDSMALSRVDEKYIPSNFEALYAAWLKVLDVKELNARFYKELADWYYWAIQQETGVQFPLGQPLDDSDDPFTKNRPTVAVIRLLTRLIFVWFLKEKQLIPNALFDTTSLSTLLKHPPHLHPQHSNYYKAILQNLFFATLNTEMSEQDEDGHKQRVWRAHAGPKRLDKYLIHTVYRYQSEFTDPNTALDLFRQVPFLNGGLFECLDKLVTPNDLARDPSLTGRVVQEGKQTVLRVDGFSERPDNRLHIPNALFFSEGTSNVNLNDVFGTKNKTYKPRGLLSIFDSYKFTIEENTPVEEEVALDPELLGKVFENLLASYNPDTKTTARKKSGSFYTPREVVDYMVDESLILYLNKAISFENKAQAALKKRVSTFNSLLDLGVGSGDLDLGDPVSDAPIATTEADMETAHAQRLRHLLSYQRTGHDFSPTETRALIAAIEQLRVLDPACGSGAFPMGMLQKLVAVLHKLDPDNSLWKAQNRAPLQEQWEAAKKLKDLHLREEQTAHAKAALEKFDADFANPEHADYARKLYLIEKCLYGVDIQPIAVQITKLRFFISLVVEQKLGSNHQRLTPLPNLETKIVAANTLLPIPRSEAQQSLLTNPDIAEKEAELRDANASHFAAKRFADKRRRKERILQLRDELAALLKAELTLQASDAERMSAWDPFDQNRHADFFDPEWMFGFQDGFDIVIGNPPYVRQEAIKAEKPILKPHYPHSYSGTADLYVYFYERAFQLLHPHGCLSFITSNKWFRAKYGADLRQYMATHTHLHHIIDFGDEAVFDALAYPTIVIATKRAPTAGTGTQIQLHHTVQVLNWDSQHPQHRISHFPDVFAAESFAVPQTELKREGWQLEPPTKRLLLERLRRAGQPLGNYCQGRFYYGIKTGLNEAFVITREQRDALIAEDPNSADIIKPFLRGRDVKRWQVEPQDLWLIFTRRGVAIERYPAIKAHLAAFRTQLEPKPETWDTEKQGTWPGRKSGPYEWFHIQDNIAYWEQFEQPKIILARFMNQPTYAWDDKGMYMSNGSSMMVGVDQYIVAILNSSVVWWFLRATSTDLAGGFLQAHNYNQFSIPIPSIINNNKLTIQAIIEAVSLRFSRSEYERLLNGLVYELFFPQELHAKQIRLFEACQQAGIQAGMDAQAIANTIFRSNHPIYGMLFDLQTVEVVRVIEGVE